ncbi:MAG: hypothetical protein PHX08_01210 [Lachnospiraceae bacterium]|nr:hypothetical protein [Lachnospiraceae bacterium]
MDNIEDNILIRDDDFDGRVIMIPNETTVIVDIPSSLAHVGDEVVIFEPSTPVVSLSGERLGTFSFTKSRLEVLEANINFSVCGKIVKYKRNRMMVGLGSLFDDVETSTTVDLPVSSVNNLNLSISNPEICIGDFAKLVK